MPGPRSVTVSSAQRRASASDPRPPPPDGARSGLRASRLRILAAAPVHLLPSRKRVLPALRRKPVVLGIDPSRVWTDTLADTRGTVDEKPNRVSPRGRRCAPHSPLERPHV